jgi:hypothetical protein
MPTPDYAGLARHHLDEAVDRLSRSSGVTLATADAFASLAATGVAVTHELHGLRLTVEAGVDALREALTLVERFAHPAIAVLDPADADTLRSSLGAALREGLPRSLVTEEEAQAAEDRLVEALNLGPRRSVPFGADA